MADWTTLPNLAVGVGGLPSGTTVTALRDNPVAIAEGAAGAPRVQGVALGGIRQAELTATGNSFVTITGLDEYGFLDFWGSFTQGNTTGVRSISVSISSDGGSSWSSETEIVHFIEQTTIQHSFSIRVGLKDGLAIGVGSTRFGATLSGRAVFGAGSYNAVRMRQNNNTNAQNVISVTPHFWENKA